jgi:hypothetical protein
VITDQTGLDQIFQAAADFDLELIDEPDTRRPHPRAHLATRPAV